MVYSWQGHKQTYFRNYNISIGTQYLLEYLISSLIITKLLSNRHTTLQTSLPTDRLWRLLSTSSTYPVRQQRADKGPYKRADPVLDNANWSASRDTNTYLDSIDCAPHRHQYYMQRLYAAMHISNTGDRLTNVVRLVDSKHYHLQVLPILEVVSFFHHCSCDLAWQLSWR